MVYLWMQLGYLWGLFIHIFFSVYDDLPSTITNDEHLKAAMQRYIDMENRPIQGWASQFDYDKREWKK